MRVRTLVRFSDLVEDKIREVNDEFEVTVERLDKLNSASNGILVEVIEKEKKVVEDKLMVEDKPKRRPAKKK